MPDVTKIFLTLEEQRAFDKFADDTAELTKGEFELLRNRGLIKNSLNGNSGWFDIVDKSGLCELSDTGKALRAYQAVRARDARKADRRYWITTGIAIAALVTAIASIVLQYL